MAKTKVAKSAPDKTLGMLSHLLGIFTNFIGALLIYLVAKDDFSKANARNALNFQISLVIYVVVSIFLMLILIGFFLLMGLGLLNLITSIIGAIKANEGEVYEYPLAIKFLK
ncbi:MAG TPA: DUF4870 domain-containing protein [Acidobacteriota bacterium]|nr:DUF4870 domain-containing protein [Acidobacteriota bacterium]